MRWIAPLLAALLALPACRERTPAPAAPAGVTVVDDLGRPVTAPPAPQRILSLAPGNTELVFALNLGDRLVGRTDACDFPAAAASVPSVGSLFPPDLERVLATRPDVALMIDGHAALRQALEARGIPVYVLQPRTVDAALASFQRVGRLLGAEPAVQALTAQMQAALGPTPPPGPSVFYVVWPDPLTTAGPQTFLADLVRRAGGRPLPAQADTDWPRYPLERLLADDPDVLLLPKALPADAPGYRTLRAVREGRAVVVANPDLLSRIGPRLVDGVAWLRRALQ